MEPFFRFRKWAATLCTQHRFWSKAAFWKCLMKNFIPSFFHWRRNRRWPAAAFKLLRSKPLFQAHFGGQIWEIKRLIAQQTIVTAIFPLHHRHQRLILHKICHFQPFVKLKLSKKFSWGPPFAKNAKNEPFFSFKKLAAMLRTQHSLWS